MMGTQDNQQPLFYVGFDLDSRVRPDDPLRQVKQRVDFSFVRREVAWLYGGNGHVSIDPEVILKLLFLLFFDDVKSERELMRQVSYRLDYMWFLGFRLDDPVPNHSVLSKARHRWGPEVFERLFVRTVQQCVKAGLVDGSKLHIDATLVDADASKDSVKKGSPQLVAALRRLYRDQEFKFDEMTTTDSTSSADEADGDDSVLANVSKDDDGSAKPRVNQTLLSTTDPDAAVVRQGKREPRPRTVATGAHIRQRGDVADPRRLGSLRVLGFPFRQASAHGPPHRESLSLRDCGDAGVSVRRRGGLPARSHLRRRLERLH